MKKLIAILVVLVVTAAGLSGYLWYQTSHIFVEDAVYAKNLSQLDLRGSDISVAHYETVHRRLPECEIIWDVPFQGFPVPNNSTELLLRGLNEEDLNMLRYFTNVKTVVVTDVSDYAMLEKLQALLPDAQLGYQIDLGGKEISCSSVEIGLDPSEYDYDVLLENLKYLPQLEAITFYQTELRRDQFEILQAVYPDIRFDYTVELLGMELTSTSADIDLSAMASKDMDEVLAKLPLLANLQSVQLAPGTEKSGLTLEEVAKLKQAAPHVQFHYAFKLFGENITTDDETLLFKNKRKYIKDDTLPQLRLAMDIMNNCTKVTLDNTAASDAACAQLREDYRGKIDVVWRVYFADYGSSLTDVEVLRIVYDLGDDNCKSLKYLENVRYMDIGHNEYLDYCDFVAYMPELEVAIISGAPIKTLEPFAKCTKLKFLEMANCSYIPDLEPLRNCTELEMLNIGHTSISDLSPLDDLKLTHLCSKVNDVPEEELTRFMELHPDCWTTYEGDIDYGLGWRYDENDEKLEWYAKMADAFRYPHPENKTGWYLK